MVRWDRALSAQRSQVRARVYQREGWRLVRRSYPKVTATKKGVKSEANVTRWIGLDVCDQRGEQYVLAVQLLREHGV